MRRPALILIALVLFIGIASRPARTPAIPGGIASIEPVNVRGSTQYLLVRAQNPSAPVLLFLHGGPGIPLMPLAHTFQRPLEKDFVVVQWDQRGSGKSFQAHDVSIEDLVQDTIALSETLNHRFGKKIYIVGWSWGTYLGVVTAQRRPDLFAGYIGIGQVVTWDPAHQKRGESMHGRSAKMMLFPYLAAPEYTPMDYLRVAGGFWFSGAAKVELVGKSVKGLRPTIPMFFFTGRYDGVTSPELIQAYARESGANIVWFDHSAHWVFAEENAKFVEEIKKIAR